MSRITTSLIVVSVMVSFLMGSCSRETARVEDSPMMQRALASYHANTLDSAVAQFLQVLDEDSVNARAMAFLSSTYKYQGKAAEALETARAALRIDPCQPMALMVLADLYSPQYGLLDETNQDSSRIYLKRALACDSLYPSAQLTLWGEAHRLGDQALEATALRRLFERGFFTKALLTCMRTLLKHLPPSAIYIGYGDLDTYPVRALQVVEGLRPDVCVANFSMLDLPYYVRMLKVMHGIPTQLVDMEMETFRPYRAENGAIVTLGREILSDWCRASLSDPRARPVAVSAMGSITDFEQATRLEHGFALAGPFLLPRRSAEAPKLLVDEIEMYLDDLDIDDLQGPPVSDLDESPLRRSMDPKALPMNAGYLGLQLAWELAGSHDADRTRKCIDWCRTLMDKSRLQPDDANGFNDMIKKIEARLGQ